jgi:hypothetical protein
MALNKTHRIYDSTSDTAKSAALIYVIQSRVVYSCHGYVAC